MLASRKMAAAGDSDSGDGDDGEGEGVTRGGERHSEDKLFHVNVEDISVGALYCMLLWLYT